MSIKLYYDYVLLLNTVIVYYSTRVETIKSGSRNQLNYSRDLSICIIVKTK